MLAFPSKYSETNASAFQESHRQMFTMNLRILLLIVNVMDISDSGIDYLGFRSQSSDISR